MPRERLQRTPDALTVQAEQPGRAPSSAAAQPNRAIQLLREARVLAAPLARPAGDAAALSTAARVDAAGPRWTRVNRRGTRLNHRLVLRQHPDAKARLMGALVHVEHRIGDHHRLRARLNHPEIVDVLVRAEQVRKRDLRWPRKRSARWSPLRHGSRGLIRGDGNRLRSQLERDDRIRGQRVGRDRQLRSRQVRAFLSRHGDRAALERTHQG